MRISVLVLFCAFSILRILPNVIAEEDEEPSDVDTRNGNEIEDGNENFAIENGVYVLTDSTFDAFLERYQNNGTLVEFYAPWCGHCKALVPEYEKAAKLLNSSNLNIPLAKVDATVEVKVAQKYSVQGYPTLKFWKDGQASDYDGPRDADGMVNWIRERADPNYKPPPETVITLTKDTFPIALAEPIILVEFYAPWCGHCKRLAPEYEKAAQRLKLHDPPIPLAKVDATVEKELAQQFQVTGFPTLKILRKGRRYEYSGPRDADGIVNYMKEQSKPASVEWTTMREAQKGISHKDVSIVGFFQSPTHDLLKSFKEAAEVMREDFSTFAYTFDPEIMEHLKASVGQIVIFYPEWFWSKFEPRSKVFEKESASHEDVVAFVYDNSVPMVGQRTKTNDGRRYFRKRPLVVAYYTVDFSPAHREGTQYWRNKILNVAKEYVPTYNFAIADEDEFNGELADVGLGESALDVNVVVFGKDNKRYVMDPDKYDEFTEDNLREFMEKLNEGRVRPYLKSQAAPKGDKGPVKTVVASTFDAIVKDESKDVLIEFYAPWCGHCKSLEPIYKELAQKLKSDPNVVIAKMDTTANDAPQEYKVEGFPTVYFAPSGQKDKPIKYEGGSRTVEDFVKFMKEHAVASFTKTEL